MALSVIEIAMNHYSDLRSAPIKTIAVNEWEDYKGKPLVFQIYNFSADDVEAIAFAEKDHGKIGAMCMRVIRACYVAGGAEKARAFADTDLKNMMTNVDLSIIERINNEIEA